MTERNRAERLALETAPVKEITVEEIRAYLDGDSLPAEIEQSLDTSQGLVFTGQSAFEFLILKVVP